MPPQSILKGSPGTGSPRVSVLLPVRDEAECLDRALDSLSRQTFREFEVVVADDGSRDDSMAVAGRRAAGDSRIRVLSLARRGIAPTLQAALDAANGDILVRQDADDISHPDRIRRLLAELRRDPDLDVVGSRIRGFPRGTVTEGMQRYEAWQNSLLRPEEIRRERYVESPLAHASAALRRGAVERAGGWRDVPWPEDVDLWLRLFRQGARFAKLPDELYFWAERPGRTTRTDVRLSLAAFRRCKLHHLRTDLLGPPPGPVGLWSTGKPAESWRRDLEAEGYRVRLARAPRRPTSMTALPADLPAPPLLAAFSSPTARTRARTLLAQAGLQEETDYLFVR